MSENEFPCGALLLILPMNRAGEQTVRLRTNRLRVRNGAALGVERVKGSRRRKCVVGMVNTRMLTRRRWVTFGSSRATDFQLVAGEGIEERHFLLTLDQASGGVTLTDKSTAGVWVSSGLGSPYTRLQHARFTFTHEVAIRIGSQDPIEFRLRPTKLLRQPRRPSPHAWPEHAMQSPKSAAHTEPAAVDEKIM